MYAPLGLHGFLDMTAEGKGVCPEELIDTPY